MTSCFSRTDAELPAVPEGRRPSAACLASASHGYSDQLLAVRGGHLERVDLVTGQWPHHRAPSVHLAAAPLPIPVRVQAGHLVAR